jgi:predicted nucleic-acid-binding Zn-ribbon protein
MDYTKERGMEWLNKKWNTPKACPICTQNNWAVSESLALAPRLVQERVEVGGVVYPLFLVTCSTCGYTMFFNALVAGFLPSASEEEKKER